MIYQLRGKYAGEGRIGTIFAKRGDKWLIGERLKDFLAIR